MLGGGDKGASGAIALADAADGIAAAGAAAQPCMQ
jgi:hypothetical protein